MKTILQLQIIADANQGNLLLSTMERFNAAASYAAKVGFKSNVFSLPAIQKRCYKQIRTEFGLSAQLAVRAIGKASDAFKTSKQKCPKFKKYGAVIYDQRIMSFKKLDHVSLSTLAGRLVLPFICGPYQRSRLGLKRGQADLIYRNKKFYLLVTIDLPTDPLIDIDNVIGVDLGIINIATDSDGNVFNGSKIESKRSWYSKRRSNLQSVGTKSAKRKLKRMSGKQRRFQTDVNHCISKAIVINAKGTSRGIALENLKGIHQRTTVRRKQRAKHYNWSFNQLRNFISYKAEIYGVPVFIVNPAHTSQRCHFCSHIEKTNRKGSSFICKKCGASLDADFNAALNIKAAVNWPMVSTPKSQEQAPSFMAG